MSESALRARFGPWMTQKDATSELGYTPRTVFRWIETSIVRAVRVHGRARIATDDLDYCHRCRCNNTRPRRILPRFQLTGIAPAHLNGGHGYEITRWLLSNPNLAGRAYLPPPGDAELLSFEDSVHESLHELRAEVAQLRRAHLAMLKLILPDAGAAGPGFPDTDSAIEVLGQIAFDCRQLDPGVEQLVAWARGLCQLTPLHIHQLLDLVNIDRELTLEICGVYGSPASLLAAFAQRVYDLSRLAHAAHRSPLTESLLPMARVALSQVLNLCPETNQLPAPDPVLRGMTSTDRWILAQSNPSCG